MAAKRDRRRTRQQSGDLQPQQRRRALCDRLEVWYNPRMDLGEGFWRQLDRLVRDHEVGIDRPRGSAHPIHATAIYPLDYGFLLGTRSADGGGVDVWVGGLEGRAVTGIICTVDGAKADVELKILLACSKREAELALSFHNAGQQHGILILRPE